MIEEREGSGELLPERGLYMRVHPDLAEAVVCRIGVTKRVPQDTQNGNLAFWFALRHAPDLPAEQCNQLSSTGNSDTLDTESNRGNCLHKAIRPRGMIQRQGEQEHQDEFR